MGLPLVVVLVGLQLGLRARAGLRTSMPRLIRISRNSSLRRHPLLSTNSQLRRLVNTNRSLLLPLPLLLICILVLQRLSRQRIVSSQTLRPLRR